MEERIPLNRLVLLCAALSVATAACESKKEPVQAATQEAAADAAPAKPDAPTRLAPPPGEPGPILIRLENNFPTQIFAAAASPETIAFAMQSDARDASLCTATGLQICFRGYGVIVERKNPNQPHIVPLYESDTQSGSRVDDVAAVGNAFVFSINEGRYVGDDHTATLLVANAQGEAVQTVPLSKAGFLVTRTTLNTWDAQQALVCTSFEPQQGKPGIQCQLYRPSDGQFAAAGTISTQMPVRTFEVGVANRRAIVVWIEGGYAKAAFLDSPGVVAELGAASVVTPYIATGLKDFAVSWMGDDAQMHVDGIPAAGDLKALERRTMTLNGLDHQNISGLVPLSEGYLLSFRYRNTPQLAIIDPAFTGWFLLEDNESWRILFDYGVFDIQDAHTGKILWQTAESLVVKKSVDAGP